jgi:hypothetical protein
MPIWQVVLSKMKAVKYKSVKKQEVLVIGRQGGAGGGAPHVPHQKKSDLNSSEHYQRLLYIACLVLTFFNDLFNLIYNCN